MNKTEIEKMLADLPELIEQDLAAAHTVFQKALHPLYVIYGPIKDEPLVEKIITTAAPLLPAIAEKDVSVADDILYDVITAAMQLRDNAPLQYTETAEKILSEYILPVLPKIAEQGTGEHISSHIYTARTIAGANEKLVADIIETTFPLLPLVASKNASAGRNIFWNLHAAASGVQILQHKREGKTTTEQKQVECDPFVENEAIEAGFAVLSTILAKAPDGADILPDLLEAALKQEGKLHLQRAIDAGISALPALYKNDTPEGFWMMKNLLDATQDNPTSKERVIDTTISVFPSIMKDPANYERITSYIIYQMLEASVGDAALTEKIVAAAMPVIEPICQQSMDEGHDYGAYSLLNDSLFPATLSAALQGEPVPAEYLDANITAPFLSKYFARGVTPPDDNASETWFIPAQDNGDALTVTGMIATPAGKLTDLIKQEYPDNAAMHEHYNTVSSQAGIIGNMFRGTISTQEAADRLLKETGVRFLILELRA